jgi:hypothetical protein
MPPKKFKFLSSAVVSVCALFLGVIFFVRHGQLLSQTQVSAAQGQAAAPSTEAAAQTLPPGTIAFTAKATTTAIFLARKNLTESSFMTVAEFEEAIRKANSGETTFPRVETALIPST